MIEAPRMAVKRSYGVKKIYNQTNTKPKMLVIRVVSHQCQPYKGSLSLSPLKAAWRKNIEISKEITETWIGWGKI